MPNPKFHGTKLLGSGRVLMHRILIDSDVRRRSRSQRGSAASPVCCGVDYKNKPTWTLLTTVWGKFPRGRWELTRGIERLGPQWQKWHKRERRISESRLLRPFCLLFSVGWLVGGGTGLHVRAIAARSRHGQGCLLMELYDPKTVRSERDLKVRAH